MSDRDYYVTVCSGCRTARCWHGEIMCQRSSSAGTTDVLASVLRTENREHASWFSEENLMNVCGGIRYSHGGGR